MNVNYSDRLLRLFQKLQILNDQRHLYSIRTAFISTMPIMIAGAFATVINALPIPAYQMRMESIFGELWPLFGDLVFNGTTQIVTLMVVFATCTNLVNWYNTQKSMQAHPGICGMVGLACYTIVSISMDNPIGLPSTMTGVTGLFIGMITALIVTEAFVFLVKRKSTRHLVMDDPNILVPQAFASVIPSLIIIGIFALVRSSMIYLGITHTFGELMYGVLSAPYQGQTDSLGTAILFNMSTNLLWLLGIHGNNALDGIAKTVYFPAMQENIAAIAAGLPAPNIITKTMFDVFVYMGGSGATLCLLIALVLFSKGQGNKHLLRYSAPTAFFNINEPLIFGIPIVLNPVYVIPFVLTPLTMFLTTYLAMRVGLVPYTTIDISWATPVLFSGYMATGSIMGSILQLINLFIGVMIYAPFVKISAKMTQLRFDRAYQDLCRLVMNDYSPARKLITREDEVGALARRLANQMDSIKEGDMYLLYQPIIDAKQHKLHSVEALLRWKHPLRGNINPMLTIALAEETGRIDKLGLWILERSILQRARWNEQGIEDFHISVNVSPHQLNDPTFAPKTLSLLEKYNVPAKQLQIEITETAALIDNENTQANLALLHKTGITIAMDDFGVGHSSLLYLRTQPITTLKIDGSLSRDVIKHPANLDIIATIHDLCNLLGVKTIIEYVDNTSQLEALMGIGAFLIQGYLFSQPLSETELPEYILELEKEYHESTLSEEQ